jgi:hypothetical protein
MTEVAVLTRVRAGEGEALSSYLRALRAQARDPSPFAGLSLGTHFARFVVIELGTPHLLFTSRFDGPERDYLKALSGHADAQAIWTYCVEPDPVSQPALLAYLMDDKRARLTPSYVIALTGGADTVARINDALALQGELARFAVQAGGLDAVDFAHTFWELPGVQRILEA